MSARLKRKYKTRKKRGGIRKHRFAACAKHCGGNRRCMAACLKRRA
jgi:hypothetical protein